MMTWLEPLLDNVTALYQDLWAWVLTVLLLVALALVSILRSKAQRRRRSPELLISLGEISLQDAEPVLPPAGTAEMLPRGAGESLYTLSMNVSNLGEQPVQLLEIALETNANPLPISLELPQLINAGQQIQLSRPVHGLQGDEGVLRLYSYVTASRQKFFCLRAHFEWEPWNRRYKVAPLGQSLVPSKRLDSLKLRKLQSQQWQAQEAATRREQRQKMAALSRSSNNQARQRSAEPAIEQAIEASDAASDTASHSPRKARKATGMKFPDKF